MLVEGTQPAHQDLREHQAGHEQALEGHLSNRRRESKTKSGASEVAGVYRKCEPMLVSDCD